MKGRELDGGLFGGFWLLWWCGGCGGGMGVLEGRRGGRLILGGGCLS